MRHYRNHEGYSDPTAGQAIANVTCAERRKRRAFRIQKAQTEEKSQPPRYVNNSRNRRFK